MPNQRSELDSVFHALADGSRRSIVERLTRGPASVKELAQPLTMALPSVMQHLQVLEDCGLIHSEKVGRVRTCWIDPGRLRTAEAWLSAQRTVTETQLDHLGDFLTQEERPHPVQEN